MKIKSILSNLTYFLYKTNIFHNKLHVESMECTINSLLASKSSLVRFGDGEFKLLSGKSIANQESNCALQTKLLYLLSTSDENFKVALPDIFDGLDQFTESSRSFWKEHLLFHRKDYYHYCQGGTYANSFISRPYIMYSDKTKQISIFSLVKKLWCQKDVIFIEGAISHNAVDNDLFSNAKSIGRIICPSENAFEKYDEILNECLKLPKDSLILITLGAAGKVLAYDLYKSGYRVLDIGSLDMEYGWYLEGATRKCRVPKHEIKTYEENVAAGYTEYLEQIIARIE